MDWGGLAVVWLVVMVWARLWVGGLVFVDDAVARRGAYGVRGVHWSGRGRRRGSWCWFGVAYVSVVCIVLSIAAQGCL